jgi:predicted Fe-Mo cluster-binding NifX family protein
MKEGRIAIPSMEAGGLDGHRSGHFGHCDVFTLVDVRDGEIEKVTTIANQSHVQGGAWSPLICWPSTRSTHWLSAASG